jgi:hypothetical protein
VTWPVWVPQNAPTASTLATLEARNPGRSDKSALIYLGWASHMMQDLSAPHHAANWSGKQHENQDTLGDNAAFYKSTPGQEKYLMDTFAAVDVDKLLGSVTAPKTRSSICSTLGVTDSQLLANSSNWSSVRPLFLSQAKAAFQSKKESGATVDDGAMYVKNAILGTIKLILCSAPSDAPTMGYTNTTFASGFVWSGASTGTFPANSSYSYNSSGGAPANTISNVGTGAYTVDFPGLAAEYGGNVQVTAYGGGSDRCKVGSWGTNGTALRAYVYCHNTAGQPSNTVFTASYVRRPGIGYGQNGGYLWADQPSATTTYTPSLPYQWNSAGQRNTVQRNGVGSYLATFPGVTVNGGSVEVTAYGSSSDYCKIGFWGNNVVEVNCYNNSGAPVDSRFTLNFTDQSPNGTASYQYAWADQPSAASYTPSTYYQGGAIAKECDSSVGTVTINRSSPGNYSAILPKMPPTFSNVKVTSYSGGAETCKVVNWYGSGSGTQVNIACFDTAGNPVDSYFDLVYSQTQIWVC